MIHPPDQHKLGKKLGVVKDPRTAQLLDFVNMAEAPVPPVTLEFSKDAHWPMFHNDQIGCCGLASQGHRIIAQERNAGQRDHNLTDDDIVAAYSAVSGYDPATGANDNGVYLLDVLNFVRRTGIGKQRDGKPHTIEGFVAIDWHNPAQFRLALWMFGGLYCGVALAVEQQNQEIWNFVEGSKAGSWGGHAIYVSGYDTTGIDLVTWGARKRAGWSFVDKQMDEAYAVISPDFLRSSGKTRAGFSHDQLTQYLASIDSQHARRIGP